MLMKKLGHELDSLDHWQDVAADYVGAPEPAYHQHRLAVSRALLPGELYAPGRRIFDFGCGDGLHLVAGARDRSSLPSLLAKSALPEAHTTYDVRENPLTYRYKLARYGFEETRQEFLNFHPAPPSPCPRRSGGN